MKLFNKSNKIKINDLKKFELNKNDVLVFNIEKNRYSSEDLNRISVQLNEVFPKNKIIFLSEGVELNVISKPTKKQKEVDTNE